MNLRFFLFSIVLMLGLPAWGGDLRVGGAVTTRADVERAEAILSGMNHLLGPAVTDCDACTIADAPVTTSDFLLYAARYLLGTSYVGGTLEAGDKEELRISLTKTDCILFVETCLDLARCKMLGYNDFSHFAEEVRQSRYRDGQIRGYGDRIHYTTEWIRRGEKRGVVRDITLDLGGIPSDRKIFYMSRNYKKYKHPSSADTDPAVRRELDAVAAAERIRADIAHDSVNYRNEVDVSVTVTMGVSPYHDGMTIQAMMNDADEKLYWGKRHGKNQVVSKLPEDHNA